MFKILVDGVEHSSYTNKTVCVTVGSAADANVRLPLAAAEHIKIYPLHDSYGGCFKVTVHARDGMTQETKELRKTKDGRATMTKTVQWKPDPPNWLQATSLNIFGNETKSAGAVFIHGHEKPGWVLVYGGDSMTIRDREIQVINWCGTCKRQGKDLWQCTCAARAT